MNQNFLQYCDKSVSISYYQNCDPLKEVTEPEPLKPENQQGLVFFCVG